MWLQGITVAVTNIGTIFKVSWQQIKNSVFLRVQTLRKLKKLRSQKGYSYISVYERSCGVHGGV